MLVALVKLYVGRDQLAPVFILPRFYLSFALLFSSFLCEDMYEKLLYGCASSNSDLQYLPHTRKTNGTEGVPVSFIDEKMAKATASSPILVGYCPVDSR